MQKESISKAITEILNVDFTDIEGRTYRRRVNYARDMFCYFLRKETDATFMEIGSILGRSRSTVCESVRRIEELRDRQVKVDINNIQSMIHDC